MRKYGTTEKIEEVKSALEIESATPENPVVLEPVDPVGGVGGCTCGGRCACDD